LFLSGSALRRRFAFRARSTGAKVSGKKNPRVQDLAKIIVTQKTQCQPKELVVILEGEKTVGISIDRFMGDETKHAQATDNRAKHGPKEDGRGKHCHENDVLYENDDDMSKSIYSTLCYPQKRPKTT